MVPEAAHELEARAAVIGAEQRRRLDTAYTTSGSSGPAGWSCQMCSTAALVSAGNFTLPTAGSDQVSPRSSLMRTLDPQCMLVLPTRRRVPSRVSMATE